MQCYNCKHNIGVGWYVRYKGKNFCDRDCLAEYLVEKAEDDVEEIWYDTPENLELLSAEEKEEIRKDIGGYYED